MNYLLLTGLMINTSLILIFYAYKAKKLETKVDRLLENKVDEVLATLKEEVPMANTFIKGALQEKLRLKALVLVQRIVPEIKGKSLDKSIVVFPFLIAILLWIFLIQI